MTPGQAGLSYIRASRPMSLQAVIHPGDSRHAYRQAGLRPSKPSCVRASRPAFNYILFVKIGSVPRIRKVIVVTPKTTLKVIEITFNKRHFVSSQYTYSIL
jgi:hypothetical protein